MWSWRRCWQDAAARPLIRALKRPSRQTLPNANAIPGRCDAGLGQFAIGKPASIDLLSQVRARTGSQDARILGPDDMVTLEYRSERVNVNTDASGKVTRINCG
ncbi:Lipoprotein [Pseudomonas savastanoi pv. glycinea]|nr:Lipoprotein [Pseudomonas savastanoi pv. glycinea]RMR34484.1 Lipoprotein [Pseudomonas savastanoi pv. glycinea]RMU01613.1 Lipoprotein [Pseudomonas savastanoi pv. glycinea]RMW30763.1 Lipoprotein [Pseudomonas savastanoi pv. glycinea]